DCAWLDRGGMTGVAGAELTTVAPGNAPYIFAIPATCGEAWCRRSACQCLTPSRNVVETRINRHAAPPAAYKCWSPATSMDGLPASGLLIARVLIPSRVED